MKSWSQRLELGDRGGLIHGQLGVLLTDGVKAQCHICGKWYKHLGNHVVLAHTLACDEYRVIFGLRASTGLIGPELRDKRQKRAKQSDILSNLEKAHIMGLGVGSFTFEQRSHYSRDRKVRLEQRLDPRFVSEREKALKAAREAVQKYKKEGRLKGNPRWPGPPKEAGQRGRLKWKQLLQDPEYKATWAKKISEAHGGQEEVICVICGIVFRAPRWLHRRVCSTPCLLELRRQNALKNNVAKRAEVRVKLSKKARDRQYVRDIRGRFVAKSLKG